MAVFGGPASMMTPRWRQAFTAAAIAPNLLCGVLGAAPKPFSNSDSSLPAPRSYPVSLRTWTGQTNLGLIGKDQFFGAPGQAPQFDQQLPRAPARLLQNWTQSLLQSTLNVPLSAANLFERPTLARQPLRSWEQNLLASTLAPGIAAAPFTQVDWPLTRVAAYPPDLRNWAPGTPLILLGRDTMFGGPGQPLGNFDWQLPRSVRRAIGDGQAPPLTLTTVTVSIPFLQTDWPLPGRPGRIDQSWSTNLVFTTLSTPIGTRSPDGPVAALRRVIGDAQGMPLTLLAAASTPFRSPDSRLPPGAPRSGQSWSQCLLFSTLAPAPVASPLLVYDSRLPAKSSRGAFSWIGPNAVLGANLPPVLVGGPRYIISRPFSRRFLVARPQARNFIAARSVIRTFEVSALSKLRFDALEPAEYWPLTFNFVPDLAAGETLTGILSVTVTCVAGADPSPAGILNGAQAIDATSTKVIVPVKPLIDGNDYQIVVATSTTNSLKGPVLVGVLPVRL